MQEDCQARQLHLGPQALLEEPAACHDAAARKAPFAECTDGRLGNGMKDDRMQLPSRMRRVTGSHALIHAALSLGLFLPGAIGRAATSAPDSATIDRLSADVSRAQAVRVTAATGTQMLRDVQLDTSGVSSARWGHGAPTRPALFTSSKDLPPPTPQPIAWRDISHIETGATRTAQGALVGLAVGALAGWVFWSTIPTGYDGGQGPASVVIGVPAMVGFGFGLLFGSQSYSWSTVYPRASEGDWARTGHR